MPSSNKQQKTVTLDRDTLEYLEKGVKEKRFSSISHGIDYAVYELKKREQQMVKET
jgi:Arc/MetJ-type ribon-helix-helix transcriptional regulator